ncbi:MAG: hypothetical protein PHI85_02430 [Victivallaceae bacterium]|nr:hypothetical protein [Victivallaceae bacterium]
MRKYLALFAALLCLGCAREIVVPEVMQQPVDGKLYLRTNLWFENPAAISCVNYQTGRILPIGTAVVPVRATERTVVFRDERGVEYTVEFDPETMMIPMQEYLKRIFTLLPPDVLLKDVKPESLERIQHASVAPGMTREEVIFSFGYPVPGRTPELSGSSYLYYQSPDRTFRVVFKGDEVRSIVAPQN